MRKDTIIIIISAVSILAVTGCQKAITKNGPQAVSEQKWKIHDPERPLPPVVDPGPAGPPVLPPSDAIILFDGKDLSYLFRTMAIRSDTETFGYES